MGKLGTPRGYTPAEWAAVEDFIERHTDGDGNCDVEAMNAEARANWERLYGPVTGDNI